MAIDTIKATAILDGAIGTADLADNAVTTAKITDGNITSAKIGDGEVSDAKIASGVTASKLTGALPAIDGSSLTGVDPADGSITTAKLNDGAVTAAKIGSLPTGSVLQVVRQPLDARYSFNAQQNVWRDSGLTASITPSSSSNNILVMCRWVWQCDNTSADTNFRLRFRIDSGSFADVNPPSSYTGSTVAAYVGNLRGDQVLFGQAENYTTLHSPSTTGQVDYRLEFTTEGTVQLNRSNVDSEARFGSCVSEFVLMEIAG